ncbi:hypothetical protein RRG08_048461 [Elysia crispata]|uniref:Uncharacterized protein n=1 Tax=Elysia crispata TaxID=231223 RepID=A0AAE1B9G6_9GAST|nr:hypothetical protein RRG08_048461 [Elysia crispata]
MNLTLRGSEFIIIIISSAGDRLWGAPMRGYRGGDGVGRGGHINIMPREATEEGTGSGGKWPGGGGTCETRHQHPPIMKSDRKDIVMNGSNSGKQYFCLRFWPNQTMSMFLDCQFSPKTHPRKLNNEAYWEGRGNWITSWELRALGPCAPLSPTLAFCLWDKCKIGSGVAFCWENYAVVGHNS